jgi:hypothetical protein
MDSSVTKPTTLAQNTPPSSYQQIVRRMDSHLSGTMNSSTSASSSHHGSKSQRSHIVVVEPSEGSGISTPEAYNFGTRPTWQHIFWKNKARDDSDIRAGDYYRTGTETSSSKGHNFVENEAHGHSIFFMGNTDGETAIELQRLKEEARIEREWEARAERERAALRLEQSKC